VVEEDLFFDAEGVDYELKPVCALPPSMERQWPVRINERQIPNLISTLQYNVITAIGAFSASASILVFFFLLSLATSLFFIPSRSMDPTLQVGDVLLVEKISPRLPTPLNRYEVGDVVLFKPPDALREIVALNGGKLTDRDLFVKRVAAVPGDTVTVDKSGSVLVNHKPTGVRRDLCDAEPTKLIERYIEPGDSIVEKDHVLLLGDCGAVSVDGRVWGTIKTSNIVGRPMVRTWPTSRMSTIPSLPKYDVLSTIPKMVQTDVVPETKNVLTETQNSISIENQDAAMDNQGIIGTNQNDVGTDNSNEVVIDKQNDVIRNNPNDVVLET